MSVRTTRYLAVYSIVSAIGAVLVAPLLALAYSATSDGAEELESGLVSAWENPTRDLLHGFLTFASPDGVYTTYVMLFAVFFPAVLLAMLVVRAQRIASASGPERWGWRLVRVGYIMFGTGLSIVSVALIWSAADGPIVDPAFLILMFPGLLISIIGSTFLGVSFIRSGYRPRTTAWLLALSIPLWITGSSLGHNSIGLLPWFVGWGLSSARMLRAEGSRRPGSAAQVSAPAISPTSSN